MGDINKAIDRLSSFSFNKQFIAKDLKADNKYDLCFNANSNMQIEGSNKIKQYMNDKKYFKE